MKLDARRILVRCPNWVGDFVMATPIYEAVRAAYPAAHVTLSMRPYLEPVARGLECYDSVHYHPPRAGTREIVNIARALRSLQFDAALILPNSFESALVAALARIRRRIGYAMNGRGMLLTDRIRPPMEGFRRVPIPMPEYWATLAALAGVEVKSTKPRLAVDAATLAAHEQWLQQKGIREGEEYILVAPGASFGASKLWKTQRFAESIDALRERTGAKAIVQFGPGEEAIAREIVTLSRSGAILADDPPLDLHRLKAAAARCRLLLCTDSGVRHYGVAFDRPVICIMGPNDPRYTASNLERTVVVREEVDCGPCQLKACPLDHRCMERITTDRVVGAAMLLWERNYEPASC